MAARIVVLISGSGSNMLSVLDACRRGELDAEVVAVMADRPCRGLELAAERGVTAELIAPGHFDSRDEWNVALTKHVEGHDPALVVSAGFMRILGPVFVDAFEGRLINLHPSLLPSFPGAHAVDDALAAGVRVTGTTIHFVDREVDHGAIILQEPVRVEVGDDAQSLHARIKEAEHVLLPRACRLLLDGSVVLRDGRAHWRQGHDTRMRG